MTYNYLDLDENPIAPEVLMTASNAWLCSASPSVWAIPFFSYLARNSLKLGLLLFLALEQFPDSLGAPVRPVLGPVRPVESVRPLLGPIRMVDLLSAFFFLSCPPSVEVFVAA